MKISCEQRDGIEDEIIIRYSKLTPQIMEIISSLENKEASSVIGKKDDRQYMIRTGDIYYFESVDNYVFAYTDKSEYQLSITLSEIENKFYNMGFFRCNKSMVININKIVSLKSEMGSRINAELANGEHVIVSRRYSKGLKQILKGGR